MILSIPDAIAQILEEHLKKDQAKLELDYAPKREKEENVEYVQTSPLSEETGIPDELIINPMDQTLEEEVEVSEEIPMVVPQASAEPAYAEASATVTEDVTTSGGTILHKTTSVRKVSIADAGFAPECPDCGNLLEFGEGCMMCRNCGYSKCG